MDSFDLAGLISKLLPGLSVAFCFRGYVPDEQSQFFRTAAMAWPGVRVMTTTGKGHRDILSAPDVIQAIVEFVDPATAP